MQLGVPTVSAYAFSTENWRRSPEEVRFLMGFNKDVIRRRRDELAELGVRIRWAGRAPGYGAPSSGNSRMPRSSRRTTTASPCNSASTMEDGPRSSTPRGHRPRGCRRQHQPGQDRRALERYLDEPDLPDVDLFVRTSGEQRTSNFLLWQSAYAELVFLDTLFPDFDRRHLWQACEIYASRDRRYGGAQPNLLPVTGT